MRTVMLISTPRNVQFASEFSSTGQWLGNYIFNRPPDNIYESVVVPEPYQAGHATARDEDYWGDCHPLRGDCALRNTVPGTFPPGRWHQEGFRGTIQLW